MRVMKQKKKPIGPRAVDYDSVDCPPRTSPARGQDPERAKRNPEPRGIVRLPCILLAGCAHSHSCRIAVHTAWVLPTNK